MGAGSGAGAGNRPVTVVWGLSRHEWGRIHYWVALGLMAFLAMHLILHWKWIVCVLQGKPYTDVFGRRFVFGIAGLVLVTRLATTPLVTPSQTTRRSQFVKPPSTSADRDTSNAIKAEPADVETVRGFITFEEVARKTVVPVADILDRLGLPGDTLPSEKIGRLLRTHGLDMPDLRRAVGQDESNQ